MFLSISSCLLHLLICVSNSSFPLGPSQLYSTARFQSFYITTEYHPNVVWDTKAMRSKVLWCHLYATKQNRKIEDSGWLTLTLLLNWWQASGPGCGDFSFIAGFQKRRFWFLGRSCSPDSLSDATDRPISGMQSDDVTFFGSTHIVWHPGPQNYHLMENLKTPKLKTVVKLS